MTVFYLIRHAYAVWAPDEQRPLSSKRHEDARRVVELLYDLPITRIFSSPYQRARQTVAPLAIRLGLPVLIEPDLRERKLGDETIVGDFFIAMKRTWQDPSFAYPGGETNAVAQLRGVVVLLRFLERYPGGHLVLSTHGNLMALVLKHFDPGIDYIFWKAMTMPDIYVLDLSQSDKPAISRLWKER
jgi:2,3-bisphosphoglycerate-dependent phosphoglycerate mutase